MTPETVIDVDLARFEQEVIARSHDTPVVVDFWAEWCGPCKTLGPVLEDAVAARGGEVVLAKVDVDANQPLAQRYRVQGIPAVKAFRNGAVVAEFTGAQPRQAIEDFLDRVVPSANDRAVATAAGLRDEDPDEAVRLLEAVLEDDPRHRGAALELAEMVVGDDPDRALELVRLHRPDPRAEAVVAATEVQAGDGDITALRERVSGDETDGGAHLALGRALAAAGEHDEAAEHLLAAIRLGGEARETAREQLLSMFTVLGDDHEVVRARRPQLASALF